MIDFHCHLDLYPDPKRVIDECVRRGIHVLSVTTTPSAWRGTAKLTQTCPRIQTALGLHPQIVQERKIELQLFESLIDNVRYIGEIGLDGGPESKKHHPDQLRVFRKILDMCGKAGGRVMSLHSRRAANDVLLELKKFPDAGTPVLHWFSGSKAELKMASDFGCWFSVGPGMLRSAKGKELIKSMPRSRLLTESDGPFVEIRGAAVFPWAVEETVSFLGEVWKCPVSEVNEQLANNLRIIGKLANSGDAPNPSP
ncbi:hydrolase TatD [Thalassospira lucentensis]|uniref:Hydrolase TatD n=1 Tax=Thalassospira lucentensis TaxID=168935 RepID=A0A154L3U6_9PROT|nr:Qat anti-phage system TatD family nuclease QatD [Thalassospira lucentensis]KZB63128.1 hydrolase TatD [Thalassospira lucentensis]